MKDRSNRVKEIETNLSSRYPFRNFANLSDRDLDYRIRQLQDQLFIEMNDADFEREIQRIRNVRNKLC